MEMGGHYEPAGRSAYKKTVNFWFSERPGVKAAAWRPIGDILLWPLHVCVTQLHTCVCKTHTHIRVEVLVLLFQVVRIQTELSYLKQRGSPQPALTLAAPSSWTICPSKL